MRLLSLPSFYFFPDVACHVAPAQQEHVWSGSSCAEEGRGVLLWLVSAKM